jgi:iron complex transport system permease protein
VTGSRTAAELEPVLPPARLRERLALPLLGAAIVAAAIAAIAAGPSGWRLPWSGSAIVTELRAPRVGMGALVGAALATAGVAMQALLRNPLAEPFVLGMSGGASAGAIGSLWIWPGLPPGPMAAAGAAAAAALVRGLCRGPHDAARLLLAGVTVGSLLGSATGLALELAPAERLQRSASHWLFGGLGAPAWSALLLPALLLGGGLWWLGRRSERLDRLSLGDDVATSLGVEVARLRRGVGLVAVLLTASAVAASGLVGFVGLIAPHAARRLVGAGHRRLLPAAALAGGLLVVCADLAARMLFAPRELPVGLVTAAVGGPLFLALLHRARGEA